MTKTQAIENIDSLEAEPGLYSGIGPTVSQSGSKFRPILFEFSVQSRFADPQQFRCHEFVPIQLGYCGENRLLFDLRHGLDSRLGHGQGYFDRSACNRTGEVHRMYQ